MQITFPIIFFSYFLSFFYRELIKEKIQQFFSENGQTMQIHFKKFFASIKLLIQRKSAKQKNLLRTKSVLFLKIRENRIHKISTVGLFAEITIQQTLKSTTVPRFIFAHLMHRVMNRI